MAGLLEKRRSRRESGASAAGMADIAFLLLIFFLVVTTIDIDTGIGMTLPPPLEDEEPPPVRERNMLNVLVDAEGRLLVNDEPSSVERVRETVKTHVLNNGEDPNYSESPDDAVVSIRVDRDTPYDRYIAVLDEVWMGYFEMWDAAARSGEFTGGQTWSNYEAYSASVEEEEENLIRENIPPQISIAEPD